MNISKKHSRVLAGKAVTRRAIRAAEEDAPKGTEIEEIEETGTVEVAPEATELVFEAEDVAQLVAEVTGQDVEVEADEDSVIFTVGDFDYTVEPEGTEEILESSSKVLCGSKSVKASSRARRQGARTRSRRPVGASTRRHRRPVSASTRRPVRKVSK
jgi:hypothetical protein